MKTNLNSLWHSPRHTWADSFLFVATKGCALLGLGLSVIVLMGVIAASSEALEQSGPMAFLKSDWRPSESRYGSLSMVAGTLVTSALALLFAVPLSLGVGILSGWLTRGRVASLIRSALQVMAGIPSVVFGLWGLSALIPLLGKWHPPGSGWLAASLVLCAMILPTMAISLDSTLRSVPPERRRNALALGLSPWGALRLAGRPELVSGLALASILGLVRALGETVAVLLVAGNVAKMPAGLFEPVRTLTAGIALEMAYADHKHRSALYVLGLLALLTIAIVLTVPFMARFRRQEQPLG